MTRISEKEFFRETIYITELERRNRETTREMQTDGGNFPRNLIDEAGQELSRLCKGFVEYECSNYGNAAPMCPLQ